MASEEMVRIDVSKLNQAIRSLVKADDPLNPVRQALVESTKQASIDLEQIVAQRLKLEEQLGKLKETQNESNETIAQTNIKLSEAQEKYNAAVHLGEALLMKDARLEEVKKVVDLLKDKGKTTQSRASESRGFSAYFSIIQLGEKSLAPKNRAECIYTRDDPPNWSGWKLIFDDRGVDAFSEHLNQRSINDVRANQPPIPRGSLLC
jgi:hypothetical protein